MKILHVEDNELNRKLVRVLLAPAGHEIVEAESAGEAIEKLREAPPPDLVLLDISLPGGGLTVAAHVRSRPELSGVKVVALTALAMRGDRERFLAAGCDEYISKPLDARTFASRVEELLLRRNNGSESV